MDPIRTFQPTLRPYSQVAPADITRVAYQQPVRREHDRPATDLSSHLGHDLPLFRLSNDVSLVPNDGPWNFRFF